MNSSPPLSEAAFAAVATAIFEKGAPVVVEAYSAFDCEPREFQNAAELCAYAMERRASGDGSVHLAIHYPDTAGSLLRTRRALDPTKCDGKTYRFESAGWGVVSAYLHVAGASAIESFLSANSEKRAQKWSAHLPEFGPTSAWEWPAVARHVRRLSSALRKVNGAVVV